MSPEPLCRYLAWDSEFFGRRIARITAERLSEAEMDDVMEWCRTQEIDALYFLADADDRTTVEVAEQHRFHFVDIRMTFERAPLASPLSPPPDTFPTIRLATPDDIPALRALAHSSHQDSRFYYDAHFSEAQCAALYETWIEKSCLGYAEAVLVAEASLTPVGYISCHLSPEGEGSIGLVAIGPEAQGRGLGQRLVQASLEWFTRHGASTISVVTQGRNTRAQRLYQRCGFVTRSLQLWYHWWKDSR